MKRLVWLIFFLFIFSTQVNSGPDSIDPYKVLPSEGEFADQSIMVFKHLSRIAQERSWLREVEVARIRSETDWNVYKNRILRDYKEALGLPFPEKTPLNAERVKVLDRDTYRIENIIYQSMPEIYVTANLYVPQKGQAPFPGIIFPCGHSVNGKASTLYHSAALGLVQKGYVVLVFDPPGQGERYQYLKDDGTPLIGKPTTDHSLLANPLFLMGKHLMALRLWDAIRGIDYLLSREEVDPDRIGCTGNSGGGTVTLHLVPVEPRIKVAVPVGTVNSPDMELGTGGIGDGEQNLPMLVRYGITHADLMMLAYPRPYRLIKESQGSVRRGTRVSFVQAQFLYETLGNKERMSFVETEWPHGYFNAMREPMYYWFGRWFYNRKDDHEEPELQLEEEKDLLCSKSGQILNERGKSIPQWISEQAKKNFPKRIVPDNERDFKALKEGLLSEVRELMNNPQNDKLPISKTLSRFEEDGISIEKIVLYSEKDIYLPCLYFKPKYRKKVPTIVLTDSEGKTSDKGMLAKELAGFGYGVFAVDLRGIGETRVTKRSSRDSQGSYQAQTLGIEASLAYDGLKLGRSIFAMRVYDLIKSVDYLCSRDDVEQDSGVAVIGKSSCGPIALYAAAIRDKIKGVLLDSSLASFSELTSPDLYSYNFIDFLPRVLCFHDLPQIAAGVIPGSVWLLNSLDSQKRLKDEKLVEQTYEFSQGCYSAFGVKDNFQIRTYSTNDKRIENYLEWVKTIF
ncbi:alpha/beta fold hydrolase [candidate division KSB1 bacterium]